MYSIHFFFFLRIFINCKMLNSANQSNTIKSERKNTLLALVYAQEYKNIIIRTQHNFVTVLMFYLV